MAAVNDQGHAYSGSGRRTTVELEDRVLDVFFSLAPKTPGTLQSPCQVPLELEPSPGRVFPRFFFRGQEFQVDGTSSQPPKQPHQSTLKSPPAIDTLQPRLLEYGRKNGTSWLGWTRVSSNGTRSNSRRLPMRHTLRRKCDAKTQPGGYGWGRRPPMCCEATCSKARM